LYIHTNKQIYKHVNLRVTLVREEATHKVLTSYKCLSWSDIRLTIM
jgi:hypothetical protein